MDMKLIVGLGNPGPEYERTRHNAGFMLADTLARMHTAGAWRKAFAGLTTDYLQDGQKVALLKPLTFMNLSGRSVRDAMDFYRLAADDLLVLVDDVALPLGKIRIRGGGSSGGHNGLAHIASVLKGDLAKGTDFARLRLGVGQPGAIPLERYVLSHFSPAEEREMDDALIRGANAVDCWVRLGTVAAMNEFNGDQDRRR